MNENEIKDMIQKYHIVDGHNGKLRVPSSLTPSDGERIKAAKADILKYFESVKASAAQIAERELATFESIPGLIELRDARMRWAEWYKEFKRRMEDEMLSNVIPTAPKDDLKALEATYPEAVFALCIEKERNSANYEIAEIASEAYKNIMSGVPIPQCKEKYDDAMRDFCNRKMWD